jgi:hypothetical protein
MVTMFFMDSFPLFLFSIVQITFRFLAMIEEDIIIKNMEG